MIARTHSKTWLARVLLILSLVCISDARAQSGIRSGLAQLKILPGTRLQNLASSMTAGLDEPYALYANPAAVGFIRHHQWGVSHNRWIAGLQANSLLVAHQFKVKTGWTERLNFALGMNHLGLAPFDATGGQQPAESAQDFLGTLSFGIPIGKWQRHLSVGGSFKYLHTTLAGHSAQTQALDLGILWRTRRYSLSNFGNKWSWIGSGGISISNWGKSLRFIKEKTPLPRSLRAGIGINLGYHDGPQFQLLGDYQKTRDEVGSWRLGLEIQNLLSIFLNDSFPFSRTISVRGGYNFNPKQESQLISKFTLGLSIKIDDYTNSERSARRLAFPPPDWAARADLGFLNSSAFNNNVYQGTASWFPLSPESFDFTESDFHTADLDGMPELFYEEGQESQIEFAWSNSRDADLYDNVNYLIVISQDRSAAENRIQSWAEKEPLDDDLGLLPIIDNWYHQSDTTGLTFGYLPDSTNGKNISLSSLTGKTIPLVRDHEVWRAKLPDQTRIVPGSYYWTVVAYDKNLHLRNIGKTSDRLRKFHVKGRPNFTIKIKNKRCNGDRFEFDVEVSNNNEGIQATSPRLEISALADVAGSASPQTIYETTQQLTGTERLTLRDFSVGIRQEKITALINPEPGRIPEKIGSGGNPYIDNLDSVLIRYQDIQIRKKFELAPLEPNVHFASSFAILKPEGKKELRRLAAAFNNPLLAGHCIKIDGHTDLQGWKERSTKESEYLNLALSRKRVSSVRRFLVDSCRVDSNRISIEAFGQNKPVYESHAANRRVEISLFKNNCPDEYQLLGVSCLQPINYGFRNSGVSPVSNLTDNSLIHATCDWRRLSNCPSEAVKVIDSDTPVGHIIEVTNNGSMSDSSVVIRESMPEHVKLLSFTRFGPSNPVILSEQGKKVIKWKLPDIRPGERKQIAFRTSARHQLAGALKVAFTTEGNGSGGCEINPVDNDTTAWILVIGENEPAVNDESISSGPGKPNEPMQTDTSLDSVKHVVRCGESLGLLAKWYYGDSQKYHRIFDANRKPLKDVNDLQKNQIITIPHPDPFRVPLIASRQLQHKPSLLMLRFKGELAEARRGDTLSVEYKFCHPVADNDIKLEWHSGDELLATQKPTYIVRQADMGKMIHLNLKISSLPKSASITIGPIPRDRDLPGNYISRYSQATVRTGHR